MAFATIDVTKGITGTIPVANGGTGIASGTTGQFLKFTGSTTVASAAAPGKIGQVQYVEFDTNTEVTSTGSQTATYLTDQITPTATSSKIEVTMHFTYTMNSQDPDGRYQGNWRIFRQINGGGYSGVYPENNNTNIAYGYDEQDNTYFQNNMTLQFIDAPSTTDAVDYKLYITLDEGNSMAVGQSQKSQVILKEILA
jgi:hypothetical protein|tara:strand:+ start:155 stop:745 length:591 start_codon:yes stop_codon:yes gene_type:complete